MNAPKTSDSVAAKDEDNMDHVHAHEHPHQQPHQAREYSAAGMAGAMQAHAGHGAMSELSLLCALKQTSANAQWDLGIHTQSSERHFLSLSFLVNTPQRA
jgi:hypothetical protein